jgi:hypothetical protein
MDITEEMLDAGARSLAAHWGDDPTGPLRADYRRIARTIIEGSAPLIAAQALRDDAAKIERWSSGTEAAVDRLLAVVRAAVARPLRDDWRTDAADLVTDIEVAWARAQHPDDRMRLTFILSTLAGFWLSVDERDAAWQGEPARGRSQVMEVLRACPTCSGPTRETVGMVCQTCGTDYAPDTP